MCSMNLAVCIGPSILSSSSKISVDRREEVSKSVPKVISYLIDNWPTLFDPLTTSDIMNSCPTRASTSSLNIDSTTPASQSSCEGTSSGSTSSLTSTPSPVTTAITPTSISTPVQPPSYQETMAKMAQIAHHYHQKHQQLLLHQQHQQNQGLQMISNQLPVTVQPLVQIIAPRNAKQQQTTCHQVQQIQTQPVIHPLNNITTSSVPPTSSSNNNNNNNITTPKKVMQGSLLDGASEAVHEIKSNINNEKGCFSSGSSNSITSNGDDSSNSSSNEGSSNNNSSNFKSTKSNTLGRGSSKEVCVEQRCAKDMTEDWRKDIHCSVAYLRTLFNGSSPKSTSDVTTPIKSCGMSLSYRDLNNRSLMQGKGIDDQNNTSSSNNNNNNNNNHTNNYNNNTRKCLSTSRLMGERAANCHSSSTGIPPSKSIITLVPIGSSATTTIQTATPTSSFSSHSNHRQQQQQQQNQRRFIKNNNNNNHNLSNSNLMSNGKNLSGNNLRFAEKSNLMFRSSIDLASYKNSCNNNTFNQNNHHHNHSVTSSNKNINNIINLFNSYNTVNSGSSNAYHRLSHPPHHNGNNSYNNNYLNNFNNNCYFSPKSNSRSGSISIYVSQNAINGKSGIVSIHNRTDSLSSFSGAEESYV